MLNVETSFMTPLLSWSLVAAVAATTIVAVIARRRFATNNELVASAVRDIAVDMEWKALAHLLDEKARAARHNESNIRWRTEHASVAARLVEIRSKVYELVSEQYGVPYEGLTDGTSIGDLER